MKSKLNEQVAELHDSPLFSKRGEFTQICRSLKRIEIEPGGNVYKQGDSYPYVALIEKGKVQLTTTTVNGKEVLIDLREAGDLLGHDLTPDESSTCLETAKALTKLVVWKVHVQEFKKLLNVNSNIAQKVIRILAIRERRLKRKLELTNGATVEARLAYAIQQLSDKFDAICEHGYGQHIRMTHQELADMVGASRPTVSLILNKLRQTGVLNYNRNYICVKNIDGIVQLLSQEN